MRATDHGVLQTLDLGTGQLDDVRIALLARIRAGLCAADNEISALPSHLSAPSNVSGIAGVIDVGGTNARAAVVEVRDGKSRIVAGPVQRPLVFASDPADRRRDFYAQQAGLLTDLAAPRGLPYGYCFSYPARSLPNRDMMLLRWTKRIEIPGMVDTAVGAGLRAALTAAGLAPQSIVVLNDTVACLLGGAMTVAGDAALRSIGLIVGTGTNMACFLAPSQVSKCPLATATAFNLESGNFDPPHLTDVDRELDAASSDPGRQRFEKAVAGAYLPQLHALLTGSAEARARDSKTLVAMRDLAPTSSSGIIAAALLRRSADLVAAALAAVCDLLSDGAVHIFAEGGLFWGDAGYANRVATTLRAQLGGERIVAICRHREINLVGAACAALAG